MIFYDKLRRWEIFSVLDIKDVISNCEDVSGFPLPKISNLGSCSGKGSID